MEASRKAWLELRKPQTLLMGACFFAIYVIWGSTYFAISKAIETLPPMLMAGMRHVTAGLLFTGMAVGSVYLSGNKNVTRRNAGLRVLRPTRKHLINSLAIAVLLLVFGNGVVGWAEQRVSSGTAALLISTEPLWVVLVEFLYTKKRPNPIIWPALVLGIAGMAVLLGPSAVAGLGTIDPLGGLAVFLASVSWAVGSVMAARVALPRHPLMASAFQTILGGAMLLMIARFTGELNGFSFTNVSRDSWLALGYLIVAGSLMAFSAFNYLARRVSPSAVAAAAFVNPLVAVVIGWWLGGESVTASMLWAGLLLMGSLVLLLGQGMFSRRLPNVAAGAMSGVATIGMAAGRAIRRMGMVRVARLARKRFRKERVAGV